MKDKFTELRELMNEILSIFDNLDLRYLKTKIYYLGLLLTGEMDLTIVFPFGICFPSFRFLVTCCRIKNPETSNQQQA